MPQAEMDMEMSMKRSWVLLSLVGVALLLVALYSDGTLDQKPPTRVVGEGVAEVGDAARDEVRARQPRDTPRVPDEPSVQPQTVTWVVRDLADESVVPDLTLQIEGEDGGVERELSTDENGHVDLPVDYDAVPQVGAGYSVAGTLSPDTDASGASPLAMTTLWVYAQLQVECIVSCNVKGPSNVRLDFHVLAGPTAHWDELELAKIRSSPYRKSWMGERRGLRRHTVVRQVAFADDDPEKARMSFTVPRVRGAALVLVDNKSFLRPVVHPLEVSSASTHASARLAMQIDEFLSGHVDSDKPLPVDTEVILYVKTLKPWRKIDFDRQMRGTHAFGVRVKLVDGDSVAEITQTKSARVASDGSFRIPLPGRGQAIVELVAPGHPPRRQELGRLDSGRDGIVLYLPPSGPPRPLAIVQDGEPVHGAVLHFVDGSAAAGQPGRGPFRIGDSGSVDGRFLLDGHDYFVITELPDGGERVTGWFTWVGQSSIDLEHDLRRQR